MTLLIDNSFQWNYYPHVLCLDTRTPVAELPTQCPILFWTIILTSSRFHPQYFPLFPSLIRAYEQILATTLIRPMLALQSIQAVHILSMWPLPFRMQPEDPSYNYAGIVTNAALHMGLHAPGYEREYGFPRCTLKDTELRTKTWLSLFSHNIV